MTQHVIRLMPPRVEGQMVTFEWTTEPATSLYRRSDFMLEFPPEIDPAQVPASLWWRIALICLHPTWVLLGPCRVVLGTQLAPGEREFWLRLCDAATWSLEGRIGGHNTARRVDLVESGDCTAPLAPGPDRGLTAACFSGGRDSLASLGLLQELGERTLLVTTTSPRDDLPDHEGNRRAAAMREVVRRRQVELVEVGSNLRAALDNDYAGERYAVAVTELVDCLLYFGAALAVAAARGARRIVLASEADVQGTARYEGMVVQHQHFMYSAVTQRALQSLLGPTGIRYGSLTYHLRQFQVQRILAHRYPDLRDLQSSCWSMAEGELACSACKECAGIAFNLMADGLSPGLAGIDPGRLVETPDAWLPGRAAVSRAVSGLAFQGGARDQLLRCIDALTPDRMRPFVDGRAVDRYAALRDEALANGGAPVPEPGYASAFLDLADERLRPGLERIADEHFERESGGADAASLRRTVALSEWIAAPLRDPGLDRRRGHHEHAVASVRPRAHVPAPPDAAGLGGLDHLVPAPEPALGAGAGGRVLRVADTELAGNERRYLNECLDANYISSTGTFVGRFEDAFAAASGCAHGVACSSGATALQLAYAATGIGPGHEVIMPAFTMVATANAASHLGATPVFVDSDAATWNLDTDRVAEAIGPRTRAIVAVHTYGQPVDPAPLRELADRNGLVLIEDAAQAHGGRANGRPIGSLGTAAAFSFYGNKILTTGEGGMVTTNDSHVAAYARELRDHGFAPGRHFWHRLRAFNFRMSNLQAAVGLAQTERLEELVAARRRTAARYVAALVDVPGLERPPVNPGLESLHWMFCVLVGVEFGCSRDALRARLAAEGIETRGFFVPLHLQPAYVGEHRGRRFPVAEDLGRRGLYLPSGPSMSEDDVAYVADAIRRAGDSPSSAYSSPRSLAAASGENRVS